MVPIRKFCHGKQKSATYKLPKVTSDDQERFFNIVLNACPNSEIAKLMQGSRSNPLPELPSSRVSPEYCREILSSSNQPALQDETTLFVLRAGKQLQKVTMEDLPDPQRQFYRDRVVVTLDQAVKIATDPAGQGSKSWLEARSVRITGSNARQLVTYCTNRNPDWETKISNYYDDKFQGTSATAHGNRAESWARKCYEVSTGLKVLECGLMVNPAVPWLGCSHDGIVQNVKTVEFKCPVLGKQMAASEVVRTLKFIDSSNRDQPRLKEAHAYFCQVQLGMFMANLKHCDFVIYSTFDDSCVIIPVEYKQDLVLYEYLPKLQYVYFNHCLKFFVQKTVNNEN